jgi:hypothetical protein
MLGKVFLLTALFFLTGSLAGQKLLNSEGASQNAQPTIELLVSILQESSETENY